MLWWTVSNLSLLALILTKQKKLVSQVCLEMYVLKTAKQGLLKFGSLMKYYANQYSSAYIDLLKSLSI